jgi:hypothetical protein
LERWFEKIIEVIAKGISSWVWTGMFAACMPAVVTRPGNLEYSTHVHKRGGNTTISRQPKDEK